MQHIIKTSNLPLTASGDAEAITICLSQSNFYVIISWVYYTLSYQLTDSTGNDIWISDEWCAALSGSDELCLHVLDWQEHSLIWLLPGQAVTCSICNSPGLLWRLSIGSPNVFCADEAASSSVCGWPTAASFNWAVPYLVALWRK